mmetsp:Transcript_15779/g.60067  ORF Transcript_15779/g.60067 Transcript_15779/m.60067 type:complete len:204 (-) Transcript_15779:1975-2586(-)
MGPGSSPRRCREGCLGNTVRSGRQAAPSQDCGQSSKSFRPRLGTPSGRHGPAAKNYRRMQLAAVQLERHIPTRCRRKTEVPHGRGEKESKDGSVFTAALQRHRRSGSDAGGPEAQRRSAEDVAGGNAQGSGDGDDGGSAEWASTVHGVGTNAGQEGGGARSGAAHARGPAAGGRHPEGRQRGGSGSCEGQWTGLAVRVRGPPQ